MASSKLSYQAIESLWTAAGGSKALAPVMAAIAIAESGGRPSALNDTAPDYSVGLWQINYYGSMLPGRTKEFGSPKALMASPTAQARAAVAIERQQGLGAWSTYTSGAYKKYLNGADYTGGGTDTTGGTATTGTDASTTAVAASYNTDPKCLFGMDLPVVGGVCILTKGQARAILGAILIGAGGIVSAGGLIILAAYGLKSSGALEGVAKAAQVVPGAGGIAAKAISASGALKAGPKAKPKKPKQAAPAKTDEGQDQGGDSGSE
jgi:hypothetical protein